MIIPAVFAFSNGEIGHGPGLIFEALPQIFSDMPLGRWIGAIFFVMVFLAALTSAIALMETVAADVMGKLKIRRTYACICVAVVIIVLGLLCSFGYSIWAGFRMLGLTVLEFFDFFSNNIIMPVLAVLTCVIIGFVVKPQTITDELCIGGQFKNKRAYAITIRYLAPLSIVIILVSSLVEFVG